MWSLAVGLAILASGVLGGVEVRVLSPDGKPLEGARVHGDIVDPTLAEDDWESDAETTDVGGMARLDLDPGRAVELTVLHRLYPYFASTLRPGGPWPKEIRLSEPPWELVDVTGRVLSPRGEPVKGATVRMSRAIEHAGRPWTAVTDAEGRFALTEVMEDAYRVELEATGHVKTVDSAAVIREMRPLELRLRSPVRVVGRIVGASGHELPSAWSVTARSVDPRDRIERGGCPEPIPGLGADGFGQFVSGRVSGNHYQIRLPAGAWKLEVNSMKSGVARPWRAAAEVRLEQGGDPIVRLDLEAEEYCPELRRRAAAPIAGRVFDETTGTPVPFARVRWGCRSAETGADGTFELPLIDLADCQAGWVFVQEFSLYPPAGWAPPRLPLPEPGSEWLEIPLQRAVGFCYETRWADGEPARVAIKLFSKGGEEPVAESKTDENGRGCVAELPAGLYELEVQHWRDGRVPFSIPTDTLVVEVPLLGAVLVRAPEMMRDHGLDPPEGTVVRFDPLGDGGRRPIVRHDPSHFWLGGIPSGRWLVTVRAPDHREWSGEVDIEARETATVVVR